MMTHASQLIAFSGNIGSGKTTGVHALARALNVQALPERPDVNPWFERGISQVGAELCFLLDAARDTLQVTPESPGAVQERCLAEHVRIFLEVKREWGVISTAEHQLLLQVSQALEVELPTPDLLIFLDAPIEELQRRIAARARPQELTLSRSELERLEQLYERFIDTWSACSVLRIDTTELDLRKEQDIAELARRVTANRL